MKRKIEIEPFTDKGLCMKKVYVLSFFVSMGSAYATAPYDGSSAAAFAMFGTVCAVVHVAHGLRPEKSQANVFPKKPVSCAQKKDRSFVSPSRGSQVHRHDRGKNGGHRLQQPQQRYSKGKK